ncbi:hypothetical protein P692DRAFT_20882011 [Suillus brevipes Sb2]|nr:hypothetical protein P692DRAFT_20882011 [Suillus brevipes Sb2]
MNNTSPFALGLGTVVFDLVYQSIYLGTRTGLNTNITTPTNLAAVSQLFTNYINFESSPVIAIGKLTLQPDGSEILWLSQGVQSRSHSRLLHLCSDMQKYSPFTIPIIRHLLLPASAPSMLFVPVAQHTHTPFLHTFQCHLVTSLVDFARADAATLLRVHVSTFVNSVDVQVDEPAIYFSQYRPSRLH